MAANFLYANRTFTFSGKITIYKVSELKLKMLESYYSEAKKEDDFFIDVSKVEVIDAAMLQILISLKNTVLKGKGILKLKASSQPFESLLEVFGMPTDTFPK
jgi:anti-anti-sigma regulatory factor